jgi:hypothetical protein
VYAKLSAPSVAPVLGTARARLDPVVDEDRCEGLHASGAGQSSLGGPSLLLALLIARHSTDGQFDQAEVL